MVILPLRDNINSRIIENLSACLDLIRGQIRSCGKCKLTIMNVLGCSFVVFCLVVGHVLSIKRWTECYRNTTIFIGHTVTPPLAAAAAAGQEYDSCVASVSDCETNQGKVFICFPPPSAVAFETDRMAIKSCRWNDWGIPIKKSPHVCPSAKGDFVGMLSVCSTQRYLGHCYLLDRFVGRYQ